MRILLTGSSGWLGRFFAPRLRTAGHVVIGLDVAPGIDTDVLGTVADFATVDRAFARGIDAVIHAGALHKPDIVRYPKQAFIDVNISGTLNLLEAAKAAGNDLRIHIDYVRDGQPDGLGRRRRCRDLAR
jgi:UDP-glucose 4-epimerase